MPDGQDEPKLELDQKLSESQTFALFKDLESFRSLWYTSLII